MRYLAAFVVIAFVAIIVWGIFTKAGAHPLLIDAQACHRQAPPQPQPIPVQPSDAWRIA